jgi:hypothetical protein
MIRAFRHSIATAAVVAAAAVVALPAAQAATVPAGSKAASAAAAAERAWVARFSSVCHGYLVKLQAIPSPVTLTSTTVLGALAAKALPLLAAQSRDVHRLTPPASLRAQAAALLNDDDGAVLALQHLLAAAHAGNLKGAQQAFVVFLAAQSSVRTRSLALGITCR